VKFWGNWGRGGLRANVVDDNRNALAMVAAQDVLQERRLAAAEEAGQECHGEGLLGHLELLALGGLGGRLLGLGRHIGMSAQYCCLRKIGKDERCEIERAKEMCAKDEPLRGHPGASSTTIKSFHRPVPAQRSHQGALVHGSFRGTSWAGWAVGENLDEP
jgi:hypothetical protein